MRRANQTLGMPLGVFDEIRERLRPAGMTDQPHVQADRHHLGMRRPFLVQPVEIRLEVLLEIGRRAEGAPVELAVVVRQRIGDHQVLLARPSSSTAGRRCRRRSRRGSRPPRRPARGYARSAHSGSTSRAAARRSSRRSNRWRGGCGRAPPRGLSSDYVLPAPAVRHDVVAALAHLPGGVAVALERDGAGVEGALHVVLVEDVEQPPVAAARAVLEVPSPARSRLAERPARPARRARGCRRRRRSPAPSLPRS